MKLKARVFICAITLVLALSYPHTAFAVSTLTISPSGNGGFVLSGSGMDSVSALDITITYDTAALANPRVVQGGLISGALMAVNPNVPGTVRMAVVTTSPIQGSGVIATLAFDQVGSSPSRIIAFKVSISNSNGGLLPVQAQILNPPAESAAASTAPSNAGTHSDTTVSPAGSTPSAGSQIVIGVSVVPPAASAAPASKETSPAPEAMPEQEKETAAVSRESVSYATGPERSTSQPTDQSKIIYAQKKVLELFRDYKGERSVKAFTALFNQTLPPGFRQDPPIVLSNGKATVTISFIATPSGNKPPSIKVEDATLLSLKSDPSGTDTWIAELRPVKKALSATLFVSSGRVKIEFPVIVAPAAVVDLDKSGKVTAADFKLFLRDRGSAKKPKFDLNGDGKRDFVDDYIFTANYLVKSHLKK